MYQPLIWKKHKKREDWEACPHCGTPIRWIYVDSAWLPVDREPVMFIMHPDGKRSVVYKKQVYENCLIYKKGDRRFDGVRPHEGNIQHFYTCEILREHRREYMRLHG